MGGRRAAVIQWQNASFPSWTSPVRIRSAAPKIRGLRSYPVAPESSRVTKWSPLPSPLRPHDASPHHCAATSCGAPSARSTGCFLATSRSRRDPGVVKGSAARCAPCRFQHRSCSARSTSRRARRCGSTSLCFDIWTDERWRFAKWPPPLHGASDLDTPMIAALLPTGQIIFALIGIGRRRSL